MELYTSVCSSRFPNAFVWLVIALILFNFYVVAMFYFWMKTYWKKLFRNLIIVLYTSLTVFFQTIWIHRKWGHFFIWGCGATQTGNWSFWSHDSKVANYRFVCIFLNLYCFKYIFSFVEGLWLNRGFSRRLKKKGVKQQYMYNNMFMILYYILCLKSLNIFLDEPCCLCLVSHLSCET